MFLSRNKKIIYPCKPQFYYIKVGFKGGQTYIGMFCDVTERMRRLIVAFAVHLDSKGTFLHGSYNSIIRGSITNLDAMVPWWPRSGEF